jgi:hypothetical protein
MSMEIIWSKKNLGSGKKETSDKIVGPKANILMVPLRSAQCWEAHEESLWSWWHSWPRDWTSSALLFASNKSLGCTHIVYHCLVFWLNKTACTTGEVPEEQDRFRVTLRCRFWKHRSQSNEPQMLSFTYLISLNNFTVIGAWICFDDLRRVKWISILSISGNASGFTATSPVTSAWGCSQVVSANAHQTEVPSNANWAKPFKTTREPEYYSDSATHENAEVVVSESYRTQSIIHCTIQKEKPFVLWLTKRLSST